MTEEHSPIGTRRIVLLPSKSVHPPMTAYLEVLQSSKQWEIQDHFNHYQLTPEIIEEFGIEYVWAYFSSAESEADPVRHSREEVFREAGISPWQK